MTPTSLARLANAGQFYAAHGYIHQNVPWLVHENSVKITLPRGRRDFATPFGSLVGSGEQSFYDMRDYLSVGVRYYCVTPCFRDEPETDEYTRVWFMKLELIHWNPDDPEAAMIKMIADALEFHTKEIESRPDLVRTNEGFDIMYRNIELGSYGIRKVRKNTWVYGTGCAEPRLTKVILKK